MSMIVLIHPLCINTYDIMLKQSKHLYIVCVQTVVSVPCYRGLGPNSSLLIRFNTLSIVMSHSDMKYIWPLEKHVVVVDVKK